MGNKEKIPFSKMHGTGNDFIIINQINYDYALTTSDIKRLANRNYGIGFDQLLIIEKSTNPTAEFKYRIFNADGEEVNQCGNGARCFFYYVKLKNLSAKDILTVETNSGTIQISHKDNNLISVDMGKPIFQDNNIPFKPNKKKENIIFVDNQNYTFYPVSMGNPHAVIRVNSFDINLIKIGKVLQESEMFPESVNVSFLQIINSHNCILKVYERGSGMTLACGSGACASAIIAIKNKWVNSPVTMNMDGGMLKVFLLPHGNIELLGPAKFIFDGEINPDDLISSHE